MRSRRRTSSRLHRRAGLAPLELVAALPLMLFVMGLMIVFGTAAAWKVRALTNARQAQWRTLAGRTGDNDPRPHNWPAHAPMHSRSAPAVLPGDPFAGHPVVRGPSLNDTATGRSLRVNTQRLDMNFGAKEGFVRLVRPWPMFSGLPPGGFDFVVRHVLLDGTRWQYLMTGLGHNLQRRTPTLYEFDLESLAPRVTQRYAQAAARLLSNPHAADLTPIDGGDPEIRELLGITTPDEHPRIGVGSEPSTLSALLGRPLVPSICQADPFAVQLGQVDPLIKRIDRLPWTLSYRYIEYYQAKIDQLQSQPPAPDRTAQIAALQEKIAQISRFVGTLGPIPL